MNCVDNDIMILGPLCKREHDYNNSGLSTRYRIGRSCVECVKEYGTTIKIKQYGALRRLNNGYEIRMKAKIKRYENGGLSMYENKQCSTYLGVSVAENVLSKIFKNVEVMPYGHRGYDFICNRGKKIDVKSSCINKSGNWLFTINRNEVADNFLLIAFDNRVDLNPLHIWIIPGYILSRLKNASISPSTIDKWMDYALGIGKVIKCCDTIRE